jgi:hypothetical protein
MTAKGSGQAWRLFHRAVVLAAPIREGFQIAWFEAQPGKCSADNLRRCKSRRAERRSALLIPTRRALAGTMGKSKRSADLQARICAVSFRADF